MKGIIIYGNPLWGVNAGATYCDFINEASLDLKYIAVGEIEDCLKGKAGKSSKAVCSPDDTYDFETGALIALMKMCGLEKSAKAYAEIFDDTAYGDALIERDKLKKDYEDLKDLYGKLGERDKYLMEDINKKLGYIKEKDEEIKRLTEKVDGLYSYNKGLIDEIDQKNHEIISLKALKLTNESLKKDNESFRKTCEKLKEENFNLKTQISVMAEKETELIDSNKRLSNKSETLNDALNTWKKRYRDLNTANGDLVCENHKLKTDCEKLQHGYIDTDMLFCGGRQNGKQYKGLVSLFRRLPQDKIEAAYKEVYNTELPAWKKEFLNQMYGIYKESREKAELPRTLDINGTVYRKSIQIKDFGEQIKPLSSLTKREKMWDDILKEGRTPVYVERKDVHDFLEECQIAGIKWQSGKMPLETMPFNMTEKDDGMYFFVMTSRVPNGFRHVMTWWVAAYNEDERKAINYLPPMRWDLFKKGRIIVGVRRDQYNDFRDEITRQFGLTNQHKPYEDFNYTFYMYDKKSNFIEALGRTQFREIKMINGHKVVYWEDVK